MDLSDVRKNIDRVDAEIRKLFVERMTLADQVACIKAETEDKIYKPDREEIIIKKQTEGMKPELVREYTALIKRIMEVSRKYQYGRTLELRQCFPFEYSKMPAVILKPTMVKEELYICEDFSKDKVITVSSYEEIGNVLTRLFGENGEEKKAEHISCFHDLKELPTQAEKRVMTTGGHYAFLKIAEGCDKRCTYCIIPKIRGNYRSVPIEQLLAEAASLAEQGVKELILVAQETTLYGVDLYGKKSLHILLQELAKIKGIRWIRILYCYPEEIYPELIETIKNEKKVCHYLDMPIQHASDAILKRMGRRTTKAQLKETVSLLRKEIPDIVLRTTLIAGFPGETQEQHEELMEFVDEMEFERLGVFAYSPEENTPAASMPDQIPEEIKEERRDAILELQQEIAFDKAADMVGRTLYAMIEGKVADEPAYVARTYADSPDIDGYVFVNTGEMLMSGDFVKVKITGSAEYDLIGELV